MFQMKTSSAIFRLPVSILFEILNKADFLSLTRFRQTCKTISNLLENKRHRLSRRITQFDLIITIEVEILDKSNSEKTKTQILNPIMSLSGIGFICLKMQTRDQYEESYDVNLINKAMFLIRTMKIVSKTLYIIDFSVEYALEILSILKGVENLHLRFCNFRPNQKFIFTHVLDDENVKNHPCVSIEIGGLYNHLPENVMQYLTNNEVLTLQLLNKNNIATLLRDMKITSSFGNLKLLTCFIHYEIVYDESHIMFPTMKTIYTKEDDNWSLGFVPTTVSVIDTASSHILFGQGYFLSPVDNINNSRYFAFLIQTKRAQNEIFELDTVISSLSKNTIRLQELPEMYPVINIIPSQNLNNKRAIQPFGILIV